MPSLITACRCNLSRNNNFIDFGYLLNAHLIETQGLFNTTIKETLNQKNATIN